MTRLVQVLKRRCVFPLFGWFGKLSGWFAGLGWFR